MKLGILDYIKLLFKGRAYLQKAMEEGKIVKEQLHKAGIRSLNFWLSMMVAGGAIGSQIAGALPDPFGAIVAASVAFVYSIGRGLVKKDDPIGGLKPTASTSEFVINMATALSGLLLAVGHVVPPQTAAILASVAAAAIALSDSLAKSGEQSK